MAFRKGKSGNPSGRPKGIKDIRVKMREKFEVKSAALIKKTIDLALDGDMAALRLCLDRICPAIKAKDDPVNIGTLKGTLTEQGQAIITAMGKGQVTPAETSSMLAAMASQARIVEGDDLARRIEALEAKK
jgi:hypothetical protein